MDEVCVCVLHLHRIFLFSAPLDMIVCAHLNPALQSPTWINSKLVLHRCAYVLMCGGGGVYECVRVCVSVCIT